MKLLSFQSLTLFVCPCLLLLSDGLEELPKQTLDPLQTLRVRAEVQVQVQSRAQVLVQVLVQSSGLGRVQTLDGRREPDEPLQTLDGSATVVHQLVLGHRSATGTEGSEVREGQSLKRHLFFKPKLRCNQVMLGQSVRLLACRAL